jgi:hypothetical protein
MLPQNADKIKKIGEGNMKKTAIIFVSLLLVLSLTVGAHAAAVTTTPQSSTEPAQSDGMVYEADTALPLAICLFAAVGFIVYGAVKIKKAKEE